MKVPVKAKEAANMLWEAIDSLFPTHYKEWDGKDILLQQIRARAILYYRLCPHTYIFITSADTPDTIKDLMINNRQWTGDSNFMEVFNVLVNFQTVSLDDLENEFIELCPNLDNMGRYLEVIIKPIFLEIPDCSKYIKKCIQYVREQEANEKIASDEAEEICANVYTILELVREVFGNICRIYNRFLEQEQICRQRLDDKQNTLPAELNTDAAKAILQKAIEVNLCDDSYLWKGTIQLLAYFADKVSHNLHLTNKTDNKGEIITLWKPFETLFQYKGKEAGKSKLKGAKQNWMRLNTRFEPPGFEEIDALFT